MTTIVFRPHHPLSHRLGHQWRHRRAATMHSLFDDMLAQSFMEPNWGCLLPHRDGTAARTAHTRTRRSDGDDITAWSRSFTSAPRAEAIETEDSWRVQVEVPGVAADSIKVDFDDRDGALTIAGTSRQSLHAQQQPEAESHATNSSSESESDNAPDTSAENAKASGSSSQAHRRRGRGARGKHTAARTFSYRYKLGPRDRVNEGAIAATLHNGLLTVTVPKKAPADVPTTIREIPIQFGTAMTAPTTTSSTTGPDATGTTDSTANGDSTDTTRVQQAAVDSESTAPATALESQPEPFKV